MTQEKLGKIKDTVLDLTIGLPKEDRKFAIDFLRKHVRLDELQQEAIDFFNKKKVVFGSGSRNPRIVVLTKEDISQDAKNKLLSAFNKMGLEDTEIYFATNNFVVTRRYKQERQDFILRLLETLKPKFILSFDGINYADELDSDFIDSGILINEILDKDNKDCIRKLNEHFRYLKKSM